MITISSIFNEAARLIGTNGLAKGRMYVEVDGLPIEKCPMCTVGALRTAAAGHPHEAEFFEVGEAVCFLARTVSPGTDPMGRLMSWSDQPERTGAEVAAVLRQAARDAEAEGR